MALKDDGERLAQREPASHTASHTERVAAAGAPESRASLATNELDHELGEGIDRVATTILPALGAPELTSAGLVGLQWDDVTMPWLPIVSLRGEAKPRSPTTGSVDGAARADGQHDDTEDMPTWILPVIGERPLYDITTMRMHAVVQGTSGYLTLLRNLLRSSGIYALAALGAPLVSLVLAPFLARELSPSDFGTLTILNTAIGLGAGITQLGLSSAFFRAYSYDYTTPRDRRAVLATITIILCLMSLGAVVAATQAATPLSNLLLGRSDAANLVKLAASVILVQNLSTPGLAWLRAETRPALFTILAMLNLLVALGANLLLVGVAQLGVAGSLVATGCGYASIVVCTIPMILRHGGAHFRLDIARSVLAFGLPLVMNFISFWILQLSDRYLLRLLGSLAQAGTYAAAYSLGTVLSTVVITPFTLAWPTTMYAVAKRRDASQVFRLIFRWFSMLLLFAAFAFAVAGGVALDALFPSSYHAAAPVIPVVAQSIVFYGIYFVFMTGANIRRKTWLTAVFTTIAAVVNVGANLVLIPRYGAIGAADSTLIAYIVLAVVAYLVNQRLYPVPFEIGRFALAVLVGIVLFESCAAIAQHVARPQLALAVNVAGLMLYACALIALGSGGNPLQLRRQVQRAAAEIRAGTE